MIVNCRLWTGMLGGGYTEHILFKGSWDPVIFSSML